MFVQYIGDYRIHDGYIDDIVENQGRVEILIRSVNQELFKIVFYDVREVKSNKPKTMMIYSVSEMIEDEPFKLFVFVNWDEEDDAFL
jgi:hypothetical protein